MNFLSINPYTGELLATLPAHDGRQVERALDRAHKAARGWGAEGTAPRAALLREVARLLRERQGAYATLMAQEMGKPVREGREEVRKCAWTCEFYAEHGPAWLADEPVATEAADSRVVYEPLGTILGIMPWNFPFWQVLRAAAPILMAGNTFLLKHASNVPQCALALEELLRDAGAPEGVFQSLLLPAEQVADVILDARVHGVTLTGSEAAGRKVAALAGGAIKPVVMELGGSDPFIVLEDADLESTLDQALYARFRNTGQSCIAAKRMIVHASRVDAFCDGLAQRMELLRLGDPLDEATDLGPLARANLREEVLAQLQASLREGATLRFGGGIIPGSPAGMYPALLSDVEPGMTVFEQEVFGPVACVIAARDDEHALELANASRYGLGGSVWTRDRARGERLARRLASGAAFVNAVVRSDPRLPFGGIKASGFGRELGAHGMRAFTNIKTLWMD